MESHFGAIMPGRYRAICSVRRTSWRKYARRIECCVGAMSVAYCRQSATMRLNDGGLPVLRSLSKGHRASVSSNSSTIGTDTSRKTGKRTAFDSTSSSESCSPAVTISVGQASRPSTSQRKNMSESCDK